MLVEIVKVKEEVNDTGRNSRSKRRVWGSKRRTFKVQVIIKEYTTSVRLNW